ncbi:hypothetical protein [Streptomyces sp. NPDC090135]|uniref:hypothetical protein n=1 Tax=Streptomyces sp. NPDC090135 TaxID=3365957 RepID=UPI0038003ED2
MLRTLEDGSALAPARRRPVGWSVSGQGVRLHVGPTGEVLDRTAAAELQTVLSAWLHFTKDKERPAQHGDGPSPARRCVPAPGPPPWPAARPTLSALLGLNLWSRRG